MIFFLGGGPPPLKLWLTTMALGSRAFTLGQADCKAQVAKPENQLEASVFNSSPLKNDGGKTILSYIFLLDFGNFSGANC